MRRLCKSSALRAQVLLNSVPVGTVHSKERALRSQTISFSCAACGPAAHASFRCRSRLYTYRRSIMCAHRLVVENHSFSRWHPLFKIITVEATVCTPNSKISRHTPDLSISDARAHPKTRILIDSCGCIRPPWPFLLGVFAGCQWATTPDSGRQPEVGAQAARCIVNP